MLFRSFALLDSLSDAQKKRAVTSTSAPADIATSNQRKAGIQHVEGIPYTVLTPTQQRQLMALVRLHASVQQADEQKRRLSRVDPKTIVFGWMGATQKGSGHYYRIQGSTFLIEFDNTQNNANHIHTVWRDFDGDFGDDVLADHYRTSHKHR